MNINGNAVGIDVELDRLERVESNEKKRELLEAKTEAAALRAKRQVEQLKKEITGDEGATDKKMVEFIEHLNTSGNRLDAYRMSPMKYRGEKVNGIMAQYSCPVELASVEQDIRSRFGGGSWKLQVRDSGRKILSQIAQDTPGAPRMDNDDDEPMDGVDLSHITTQSDIDRVAQKQEELEIARLDRELEKLQKSDDSLERTIALLAPILRPPQDNSNSIQIQFQQHTQQLQQQMQEYQRNMFERIAELTKPTESPTEKMLREKLERMEREREEERKESLYRKEIGELKALIKDKDEGNKANPLFDLLTQQIMSNGNNSKELISMFREMRDIKQGDSPMSAMKELVELGGTMQDVFGMGKNEPEDFGGRMISLLEKTIPDVLKKVRSQEEKVGKLTDLQVKRIASNAINGYRERLDNNRVKPEPVPLIGQDQVVQSGSHHLDDTPEPDSNHGSAEQSDSLGSVTPPPVSNLSVAQERTLRVDQVLRIITREMSMMPRKAQWPQIAYDNLPGDVRDMILNAENQLEVFDAVRKDGSQGVLEDLWELIQTNDVHKKWLEFGINDMKEIAIQDGFEEVMEAIDGEPVRSESEVSRNGDVQPSNGPDEYVISSDETGGE